MQLQLEGYGDTRTRLSPLLIWPMSLGKLIAKSHYFSCLTLAGTDTETFPNEILFLLYLGTELVIYFSVTGWRRDWKKCQKGLLCSVLADLNLRPYYTNNSVLLGLFLSPLCITILLPGLRLYNLFHTEPKVHADPLYVVHGMRNREWQGNQGFWGVTPATQQVQSHATPHTPGDGWRGLEWWFL